MKVGQTRNVRVSDSCDLYTAGQRVAAGTYRDIDLGRIVVLDAAGTLPSSCNGRVAVYVRRPTANLLDKTRSIPQA